MTFKNTFTVESLDTDGATYATLEEASVKAAKNTDSYGNSYGVFQLVAYSVESPPKATVVTYTA